MRSLPTELAALKDELGGDLVLPESAGYEQARKPADPRHHDRHPAAVAYCRTSADVATAVRHAARLGLRVTPRSGGHCFAGRSSAGDLVIDVSAMQDITVADQRVSVDSGVRLGRLYPALAEHRITLPAGCGPSVGVAGLTLGGGLGLLGRRHGLTCDRLTAAEVVLADGCTVWCDDDRHPDLFWALRGAGGGHLGIVTRLVFTPVPEPEVTVFQIRCPPADAADLVAAWMERAPTADDRLTANLQLIVPGDRHESPLVGLVGAMVADPVTTRSAVRELTADTTEPLAAAFDQLRYAQAKALLGEDPPAADRLLESHRSEFFDVPVSGASVADLLEHLFANRSPGQARTVSLLPMGGAYNRVPAEAAAFVHRSHRFLVEHIAAVRPTAPAAARQAAVDWSATSQRLIDVDASGGVYPNFPDLALTDWASAYWGSNQARLQQVKRHYDPDNLFWAEQGLDAGPPTQGVSPEPWSIASGGPGSDSARRRRRS